MFNGDVILYTISNRPDLELAMSMLRKAFRKTDIPEGLVLHSDQGWYYQHHKYFFSLDFKITPLIIKVSLTNSERSNLCVNGA